MMHPTKPKTPVWPKGKQCAVMFSFDLDGETLWTSRNPDNWNRPGNLAQGSYGPKIGMPKILDVLEKHGIKSTFFTPAWIIEKYPEICREIVARGHEMGYHGYLHEFDQTAGYEKEKEIMDRCMDVFDKILKVRPRGYRSPLYEITDAGMRLMNEYDFLYSSNLMDDDYPYLRAERDSSTKIVELPTQWLWEDGSFFFFTLSEPVRRGISSCKQVFDIWTEEFDAIYTHGAFLNLVFHPQIIGRFSRVQLLDDLLTYMKSKTGAWITSGEDIAGFWRDCHGT
ncbi:MAG: polysaccharide deacetylase [Deltaproteobacteria bacterium]|nr:polysaccharide deacetylase [Deltaproteobacteria bacterium]